MDGSEIDIKELVRLCAADTELFSRTFFPKAFRQESPSFARRFWEPLDDPGQRLVNAQMFRGSSKTTRLRAYTAKRIAYGLSRTILYIGKSEPHAVRSIKWIRQQVEYNRLFNSVFRLSKGRKWHDVEAEIRHGIDEHPIWIVGMGITGSVRGINYDDFRPDLIVIDDVCDEENSSTPEQRAKIEDLVFGALLESLAPKSETPDAKMVMLQTPLNRDDVSTKALSDPAFHSIKIGCWTPETADLPLERQCSVWPARWSDETLREEKRMAIKRNKLSLFLREKECRITSPETSAFKGMWLKSWTVLPPVLTHILAIDPVPPPSEISVAKGFANKDFEALAVIGVGQGKYFIREVSINRGHDPSWTTTECFRLSMKYRPQKWLVEAVAYQRTLQWILKQAMQRERRYWRIEDFPDQRSKYLRIVDSLNGPASNEVLFMPPPDSATGVDNSEGMQMFYEQFNAYPNVSHDDALEAVAVGVAGLAGQLTSLDESADDIDEDGEEWKPLKREQRMLCP